MAISEIWKLSIAGAGAKTFEALGLAEGVLTRVSQLANSLVVTQDIASSADDASDDAAPMAHDDVVILTRADVVWFIGQVRDVDESVDRVRTFTILGGWDVLMRKPYLQTFQAASDPGDPSSGLVGVVRGRVVLNQADSGLRMDLATFLGLVITYAGLTVGAIDIGITIPFEDATDLSCADVISRSLRWVPGSICEVDDTTVPATVRIRRRGALTSVTLDLASPDIVAPVRLKPRYDLRVHRVALFYVATNRANSSAWETCAADVYPAGTTGAELDCLTRTIELAGSISSSTRLTQKVVTTPIPAGLIFGGYITEVSNPDAFSALRNWWREHVPVLNSGYVSIKRFELGTRTKVDGSSPTADLRELKIGGLTDWMKEADADLITEEQVARVTVRYLVTDTVNSTKKSTATLTASASFVATNAQTKTYSQLTDASSTEAEEAPVGLAAALYGALNPLQWEGTIPLIEEEPTDLPGPGAALNLTGGAGAWQTMDTPVQSRTTTLSTGATQIAVGPPSQLGPQDLVEIYRNNRNRRPSTSYLVRATGKTGGASGSMTGPLPNTQPVRPGQTNLAGATRVFTKTLSVSGTLPTAGEIQTALQGNYTGDLLPADGDIINLTVGGSVKMRSTISSQGTASGVFVVAFAVDGVTFYGHQTQTGLY